jgi:hypothetical protein
MEQAEIKATHTVTIIITSKAGLKCSSYPHRGHHPMKRYLTTSNQRMQCKEKGQDYVYIGEKTIMCM